jgi:hypothetical protein
MNADGDRYIRLPEGWLDPWRRELGSAWLWQPGHRLVYLGREGEATRWRIDAKAPRWTPWEPGAGPPPPGAIFLESAPGKRAAPGELVVNVHRPPALNHFAGRDVAKRALFYGLDIMADREEFISELAEIYRAAATDDRIAQTEQARTLLESAADLIERRGTCRLGENGVE